MSPRWSSHASSAAQQASGCGHGPVTVQQLQKLLVAPSNGVMAFPTQPYDEVAPGVYISDVATALTLSLLQRLGITHVLNAAYGTDSATYWGCYVRTRPSFYSRAGLRFMAVEAADAQEVNISAHFQEAAQFIDDALAQRGRVLVHCVQGMSRSAALVIAYLMIKRGMSVTRALTSVREKRPIWPNYGFLLQLIRLGQSLPAAGGAVGTAAAGRRPRR